MDSYVEAFQSAGGSMVMLAKGNRSKAVLNACKNYGGFYLGSVGGPAARLAQDCIKKVEVLSSWIIAFPTVLVVLPIVRRIVSRIVAPP
jgi:tartrate dehydratase beta subunit/fumarate hydratase class I family protein